MKSYVFLRKISLQPEFVLRCTHAVGLTHPSFIIFLNVNSLHGYIAVYIVLVIFPVIDG